MAPQTPHHFLTQEVPQARPNNCTTAPHTTIPESVQRPRPPVTWFSQTDLPASSPSPSIVSNPFADEDQSASFWPRIEELARAIWPEEKNLFCHVGYQGDFSRAKVRVFASSPHEEMGNGSVLFCFGVDSLGERERGEFGKRVEAWRAFRAVASGLVGWAMGVVVEGCEGRLRGVLDGLDGEGEGERRRVRDGMVAEVMRGEDGSPGGSCEMEGGEERDFRPRKFWEEMEKVEIARRNIPWNNSGAPELEWTGEELRNLGDVLTML